MRFVLALLLCLASPVFAERRVALVFAAEDYRHLRVLENPDSDALAVEAMLSALGFEVTVETDRDLRRMRRALDDFVADYAGADVALVFYAGHGVEVGGVNYLLPIDAVAESALTVAATALSLAEVQNAMAAVAPVGIVLLDACREDPFGGAALGEGRAAAPLDDADAPAPRPGLGRVGRSDGVLIAFSAAPGEVASDGQGENSPFTEALLRHFSTPGVEVRTALTLVQQDVYDRSRGRQLPYVESGLPQLFFAAPRGKLGERDALLIAMADLTPDLRAEIEALAAARDMPLAPLYGAFFSADLAGKSTTERSRALLESAEAFLKFREEMRLLSVDDPKVAALRQKADEALTLGAYDSARALLAEAAVLDADARTKLRDNYRARTLSQAETHGLAARAARADLRHDLALGDLAKATALYAEVEGPGLDRRAREAFSDLLWDQGDLYRLTGQSGAALGAYQRWADLAARRTTEAPDDLDWRRNGAVAAINVGDMLLAQGDLAGAEARFLQAFDVAKDLAQRKNAPVKWRHDLFVAATKLGDLNELRGQTEAALVFQEQGLGVLSALAAAEPARADIAADLASAHDRIGDLRQKTGDLAGATDQFRRALAIRESLLGDDPAAVRVQSDLAQGLMKIGVAELVLDRPQAALKTFERGTGLVAELAAKDPGNTAFAFDLSYGLIFTADAKDALQDRVAAAALYAKATALRRDLVARDGRNTDWQRALGVALTRQSDLAFRAADFAAAKPFSDEALSIARAIVAANPDTAKFRQELSAALDRVGDIAAQLGDFGTAVATQQESYAISRELVAADPRNADLQTNLAASLIRVALFDADGPARLQEALGILLVLQAEGRLPPEKLDWIDSVKAMQVLLGPAP